MNKIPKYVVIIACILVMVVLLPLGYVRYKTRYEAEQISVSTSPDGDYELVIYSVGDPDFPFGAAHGRLVLNGKEKTVAYRSFEVANDGARFYDGDLETTWYIDRVEVVVSGSEQRDELVTMRFNGQTSSRRLTTRYRREDTDIEKDSEQDSAITEKASGDSRENAESSTDSSVDPDVMISQKIRKLQSGIRRSLRNIQMPQLENSKYITAPRSHHQDVYCLKVTLQWNTLYMMASQKMRSAVCM